MSNIERIKALDRFPNYGSEGCLCGPQATPAIDCPVHHAIVEFERMDDQLRGAVDLLREFADHRVDSSIAWLDDWTRRVDAALAPPRFEATKEATDG